MNDREYLAERFEEHRTHLRAVAFRMLGSLSEVDDAVQEAWLRLSRADATGIDNLGGWLTTVVAHVCMGISTHELDTSGGPGRLAGLDRADYAGDWARCASSRGRAGWVPTVGGMQELPKDDFGTAGAELYWLRRRAAA